MTSTSFYFGSPTCDHVGLIIHAAVISVACPVPDPECRSARTPSGGKKPFRIKHQNKKSHLGVEGELKTSYSVVRQ